MPSLAEAVEMMFTELANLCSGALCADFKHMFLIGLILAMTLLVLNLPRVSVWAVDAWNQRRVNGSDRE